MSDDKQISMLDELQSLLQRQLELAHHSRTA